MIDWRHYLEHRLDMHNSHQSFAARQRLLNYDGDASNQLIWFTDARPGTPQSDQTPQAFLVLDEWIKTGQKPASASDACFATNRTLIASGPDVWDGILNDEPAGACTQAFPLYSTSRIVAGGPIEGGVFKCTVQPVERAVAQGVYGSWEPTAAEVDRLNAIFPSGVRLLEARSDAAARALRQLERGEEVRATEGRASAAPPSSTSGCAFVAVRLSA